MSVSLVIGFIWQSHDLHRKLFPTPLGYLTDHEHYKTTVQPPDTEPGTPKDHQHHQSDLDGDPEVPEGQTEVSKDVLPQQPQPDPQPLNGTPGQGGH